MNAKRLLIPMILIVTMILSACASAATPDNIANAPRRDSPSQPTLAPRPLEATQAPSSPAEIAAEEKGQQELPPPPTQESPALPTPSNQFEDYGVNPFVDARSDHLSTFAVDVDTASYSIARRYIQDGSLPPADAIRAEEFVNYFDPGYNPPADVAFALYADGAPSPFQKDDIQLIRFGVQGYQVPDFARKPATLTFLIDVSGSMGMDGRLELVKDALELLVDRLRPDDLISIVVYSDEAWLILNPTAGDNRRAILDEINALSPTNGTNAEAGIRLAYQTAMQAYRPNTTNRVILCSDGVANIGSTGPDEILSQVRGYVEEGITLTSVGVGMGNFNDVLLEQLADNGDGNYAYIDTLDEARKVLVDDLVSTLEVIAYDAKVQVDFNPDVVAYYRLIGYENRDVADQDFRNDAVDAGEIGAGHSVTAIYAVQLRPQADGRIATMQLRWQDPQSRAVQEINGNFNTWDLAASYEAAAPHYQLAVTVAQFAEILKGSPWAGEMTLNQFYEYAYAVYQQLPSDPDVIEFANLVYQASQMRR